MKQQVEDVGVRLLDLIEKQHAVRLATRSFGQEAALFAVGVAGRRADQTLGHVALHELAHVESGQRLLVVEQELSQRLRQFGLADAAGAQEQE